MTWDSIFFSLAWIGGLVALSIAICGGPFKMFLFASASCIFFIILLEYLKPKKQ